MEQTIGFCRLLLRVAKVYNDLQKSSRGENRVLNRMARTVSTCALLLLTAALSGVGEPEYRYFYRKATALQALLRVAPPGPEQDKVVRQFVAFLGSSNFQQESLLEWYAQVERTASAVKELKAATYAKFLDELQASGHPVLILYAVASAAL